MNLTLTAERFKKVFRFLSENRLEDAVITLEGASVEELRYYLNNQFINNGDKKTLLLLLSPSIKTFLEN